MIQDFNEKSYINFQKATILVGNEIGHVQDLIAGFFHDIEKRFKQKKELIDQLNSLSSIEDFKKEISSIERIKLEIEDLISDMGEKIKKMEKDKDRYVEDIKKTESSEEYQGEIKDIENLKDKEKDFKKMIAEIKSMIDFKLLSSTFHSDSKKMRLINNYKESFSECFEKEQCKDIITLLVEAGVNTLDIIKKIDEAIKIKHQIHKLIEKTLDENKGTNKIKSLELEIKIKSLDIQNLIQEKLKEEKKLERFDENKSEFIESVRKELEKLNIGMI
jgi:hypothetical protein